MSNKLSGTCSTLNSGCEVSPERETQIKRQLENLEETIHYLEQNIQRLDESLIPITVNEDPTDSMEKSPMPCLVPLAEILYVNKSRINKVNQILCSLMDRIEL